MPPSPTIKLKTIIRSTRAPFLVLTLACVFLGASIVIASHEVIDPALLTLALAGALLAHISVNTLNEYHDFRSGLDLKTVKTPFSGGSGALPDEPEMVNSVLAVSVISTTSLLIIGSYFIWLYGSGILPIGILGLALIISYTRWINKHPFICLFAPGLGFGFLMVTGTQFVLQGRYATLSWLVAVIPFLLVNNLLLLNQYPDIKADKNAGRIHFPIAYGVARSNIVYGLFTVAAITTIVGYVHSGVLPESGLIALIPMPLAFFSLYGAVKHKQKIGEYPQYLGANVAVTILSITLLGFALVM